MIKVTKVLILLLLISWASVGAQTLSQKVLIPAAGEAKAGVLNYSQSIGQTAVELIRGSGYIFTQGFQQPGIKMVTEPPHEGTGVDVYPNPATDYINVKLFGDEARKFRIELINLTGRILSSMNLDFNSQYYYIQQIDVTGLTLGFYFVRITSDDFVVKRVFKIEKM